MNLTPEENPLNHIQVRADQLRVGDLVFNCGYLFRVKELIPELNRMCWVGELTNHKRNDDIRKTVFNGGTYGLRNDLEYTIVSRKISNKFFHLPIDFSGF
jgi:hypothetical protein